MRSKTKSHRSRRGKGVLDSLKKTFKSLPLTSAQIKAGLSLAGPNGRALAGVASLVGLGKGRGGKKPLDLFLSRKGPVSKVMNPVKTGLYLWNDVLDMDQNDWTGALPYMEKNGTINLKGNISGRN